MNDVFTPKMRFDYAFRYVLEHEGGYSEDKDDSGGKTKFGITENNLKEYGKSLGIIKDIKNITKDDAKKIYKEYWWDKYHYEAINSLDVATKIFDLAVNMGPSQAHKIVQRALNWLGYHLNDDGILGGKTLGAINDINIKGHDYHLLQAIKARAITFYLNLAEKKPELNKFLNGWINRAND